MSFSTREDTYKGNPVLEVLNDGKSWGDGSARASSHFRFGQTKARLILTAEEAIRTFVYTDAERPSDNEQMLINKPAIGVDCQCTKKTSFSISDSVINQPYLELLAGKTKFGIGLRKAEALLDVWSEVELFVLEDDLFDDALELPF